MAFKNVRQLKRTTKVLIIGPTGAGKTYPGLQLERPIAALDGEDGLKAYVDLFDFDLDDFDTIDDVNDKLEAFLNDANELAKYNSVVIDGMTVAWHAALREAENEKGEIQFQNQRNLKGGFKDFNDKVFKLGKRGKNVWVTAQSKADWEVVRGQAPKLRGVKGDIDQRVWFAFDLVFYVEVKDGVRYLSVLKSRYPRIFQIGETLENADVNALMQPIFNGTAQYVEEPDASVKAEMDRTRGQIKELLKSLGSVSKGGRIPNDDARRIFNVAEQSQSVDELAGALAELRTIEQQAPKAVA